MQNKTGFIIKVKSAGKEYFYLRKAQRVSRNPGKQKVPKNINVYSLGTVNKAIENIDKWLENPSTIPQVIADNGYNEEDFKKWKQRIVELGCKE